MSKDSNKNLEDFFRNSLKNYNAEPSNDLWDRIEDNIPAKPSKKVRPAYILLALLLLLTIGFGYEYFQFKNQMLSVNETVATQTQELNELKTQLETVKEQLQSTLQSAENELVIKENELAVGSSYSDSKNNKVTETSTPAIGIPSNSNPILTTDDQSGIIEIADNINQLAVVEIDPEIGEPLIDFEPIKLLDFITDKPVEAEFNTDKKLPLLAIPKKKGKELSVELYTSVLKTFPNSAKTTESQSSINNWKPSYDFGALFNLGLNKKWDVQIGVGYSKMVITDAISTELIYAREELDQSRGIYTSFYSYTVNTPSGEMIVNTSLANQRINDGRDVEEGDPFTLDLQYQDEIQYFQLPVFVRYKLGKGRYRFTMKGGIVQKFLLEEKIKLNAVNPEFDRLQNDMTQILSDQTSALTTSTDVLFGAGAEFRMSLKNSLHLQSVFSYSLQEIYPGMQPISVGLQLGFQHKL